MTKIGRDRRRVERFAQLIDEASGGRRQHRHSPVDAELTGLVTLGNRLSDAPPEPALDSEFRAGLRAMLMATAEREGIGATAAPPAPEPRSARYRRRLVPARGPRARTAVVVGVAVGAVAFTGMSTASENAVPGDPLYSVKRSTERAQLALASSDVGRGQLYLDFAETRRQEAEALGSGLDRVLGDMDRDTTQGIRLLTSAAENRQDLSALDLVDQFVSGQRAALASLAAPATDADADRITESLALLDQVAERSRELRSHLERSCPAATSIDALGPVPGTCVALPTPSTLDDPALAIPEEDPYPAPGEDPTAGGGTSRETDPAEPPGAGTDPREDPAAAADPAPDPAPGTDGEPAEQEPAEDDSGVLQGLNRLLGDLLGG